MNTHEYNKGYEAGRHDTREQIVAFIYEHYYLYLHKWWGKDAEATKMIKNMILDIREDQAQEMELYKQPTQDE